MCSAKTIKTIKLPNNIELLGVSPIPNQTQKGPITISKSIIKLTIAEVVYFGAMLKQANDNGRIRKPMDISVHNGAVKILV